MKLAYRLAYDALSYGAADIDEAGRVYQPAAQSGLALIQFSA